MGQDDDMRRGVGAVGGRGEEQGGHLRDHLHLEPGKALPPNSLFVIVQYEIGVFQNTLG